MSQPPSHTQFLASRLRALGLAVGTPGPEDRSTRGSLTLTRTRFETLSEPVRVESARFYTLGHARLKFFRPRAFFRLPPLDVSRLESVDAIERALHRAWSEELARLRDARDWLRELGARPKEIERGGRLTLQMGEGGRSDVVARQELLLPSSGPLRDVRVGCERHRKLRVPSGIASVLELELAADHAMTRALQARDQKARRLASAPPPVADPEALEPPCLVVVPDRAELAIVETALRDRGVAVVATSDPQRAVSHLRTHTFAAAIVDAHLPRSDGLELALRLSEAPGVASLPVLLLDDRPNERMRELAASAGAAAYVVRPICWDRLADTLEDVIGGWSKRRYTRVAARLGVSVGARGGSTEVAEEIGRGGMLLRSRRQLEPGVLERYAIRLPTLEEPVAVEGEVVYHQLAVGSAVARAGVRFLRFLDGSEARWIEAVNALRERTRP